jgi:hypothetical protein
MPLSEDSTILWLRFRRQLSEAFLNVKEIVSMSFSVRFSCLRLQRYAAMIDAQPRNWREVAIFDLPWLARILRNWRDDWVRTGCCSTRKNTETNWAKSESLCELPIKE